MISTRIKDVDVVFETAPSNFSPNFIDNGTLAMLSVVDFAPSDKVLDLGCGYGVVGILAAKLIGGENVVMCDISKEAIERACTNARRNGVPNVPIILSDGFEDVKEKDFTLILSNPPYHADFSVPKRWIEAGFQALALGGKLVMVTKRLDWYKNKLASTFGGVTVREVDGYYVFVAEKRTRTVKKKEKAPNKLSKKLQRRQRARTR